MKKNQGREKYLMLWANNRKLPFATASFQRHLYIHYFGRYNWLILNLGLFLFNVVHVYGKAAP